MLTSLPVRHLVSRLPRGRVRLIKLLTKYKAKEKTLALIGHLKGVRMCLDMSDLFQAQMAFGIYQVECVDWLKRLTREGDVVLVAGAHIGYMPLALANLGCRVICFEADPSNIQKCKRNLSLNPELPITLIPSALGETDGVLSFWASDVSSHSSFAVEHHRGERVEVAVRRGDAALAEIGVSSIDGILLDVEGWECHALKGLRGVLSKQLRWAVIECAEWALELAGASTAELKAMIDALGLAVLDTADSDLICETYLSLVN